ncbi:MAG TPA: hypothetical protein VME63_05455 [Dyella sp.]|uniref:hypothetical protein n=1 Tax=Dyella sp. TaxID=1869338 RepID=UPI002BFE0FFA|nr:hypothetical protein [Dyella sp.]HTV84828.1 hypothetical protein [Dyella sp.]
MKLIVLVPFLTVLGARWIVRSIEKSQATRRPPSTTLSVFRYPENVSNIVIVFSVILPLITFFLPDAAINGLRIETDVFGLMLGSIFLFGWIYLRKYRIEVQHGAIEYGAFWTTRVDLSNVTLIRYYKINNGINLKLYNGKRRLAIFEGGVSEFDLLAQKVRAEAPKDVKVEALGEATFHD